MLTELRIENFAIIDRLELEIKPGLVTLTGETGAGKSIIIDAVETLLGGRAEATMIRAGAQRANVEGAFRIRPEIRQQVHAILEQDELLDDPDSFRLAREIRAEGRSIARVNGRTVSLSIMRLLGALAVDVHGQSEHLSLLRVAEHIHLLDRYAAVEEELRAYGEQYRRLVALRKELKELRQAESEAARRLDMLGYQANEIEAARLRPGEDDELLSERNRLANAEGLAKLAQQALLALDEGTPEAPSALDLLGGVEDSLDGLARIDPGRAAQAETMRSIFASLTEAAGELRSYIETIEFNPTRLDQVEERLGLIQNLKRKYGQSIPAILAFAENARQQMETISHASERILELEHQEAERLQELGVSGQILSQKRRQAALNMQLEIEQELQDLHMPGARFEVQFEVHPDPEGIPLADGQRVAFDANGFERIEFFIAPNPGEGLKPLVKIASGGETSRLMLALKDVLARADRVPTLIFDEIDQGIGGRVGTIVGQKLWRLARHHQVLCVTHLPQLAAFGDQHLQVEKQIQGERTITQVTDLNGQGRLEELAHMLGEVSPGNLQSAREMLEMARQMSAATHA